jgi:chromosome partitioning protein
MIIKRTPADLGVIRDLAEKAGAVIDRARQAALDPETHKKLRRFTLREATQILNVHPRKVYELLGQNDPGLPTGERTKSKRLFTLEDIHLLQERMKELPAQKYEIRQPVVLTVANFKGGVAKTFTAVTLAQYFALKGYRTLAIDLDPQASLTSMFGLNPQRDVDERQTFLPYFYGPEMLKDTEDGWTGTLSTAIQKTYWHGLDLVASNLQLYGGDFALGMRKDSEPNFVFFKPVAEAIASVRDRYDVVVIDTPPSLSFSATAAIYAADGLVIPAPAAMVDFESARSFFTLLCDVIEVFNKREAQPKRFDFLRLLISKYQPSVPVQQRIANWQRTIFDDYCVSEPMLLTSVVQNIGPAMQTIYEAQDYKGSRQSFKRALESVNAVNAQIEAEVIETIRARAEHFGRVEAA